MNSYENPRNKSIYTQSWDTKLKYYSMLDLSAPNPYRDCSQVIQNFTGDSSGNISGKMAFYILSITHFSTVRSKAYCNRNILKTIFTITCTVPTSWIPLKSAFFQVCQFW